MSKNSTVFGRIAKALASPAQATAQHVFVALAVFSMVGGTAYTVLSSQAQTDCSTQPSWPDCAAFSCTNGNWTCTQMRSNSSYQGGSSGGMSPEQCIAGCDSMTSGDKEMCKQGCYNMGGSSGGSWGGSTGGYNSSMSVEQCKSTCQSDECRRGCESMGTGYQSSMSVQRCFYPAKWYSASQGKEWEGSVSCKQDKTDCREFTESGPLISGPITFTGDATSCYATGGGTWGGSTGGGSTGGTGQSQCFADCSRGISGSDPAYRACETKCYGGTTGGSTGPVSCTYPNGVTLYCGSPHVNCSRTPGGAIMTSQEVGANGATANCVPGGNMGGSTGGGYTSSSGQLSECAPGQYPTAQAPCIMRMPAPGGMMSSMPSQDMQCVYYASGVKPAPCDPKYGCPMVYTPVEYMSCSACGEKRKSNPQALCEPAGQTGGGTMSSSAGYQGGGAVSVEEIMKKYGISREQAEKMMAGWNQGGYNQGGYQGGWNQGGQNYNQGNWNQGGPQNGYNQGNWNQGGFHGAGDNGYGDQSQMMQQMMTKMKSEILRNCDHFSTMYGPQGSAEKIKALGNQCRKDLESLVAGVSPENMGSIQTAIMQKMEGYRSQLDAIFYESQAVSMKGDTERYIKEMEYGAKGASQMIEMVSKKNPAIAQQMKTLQAKALKAVVEARAAQSAGQFQKVFEILDAVQQELAMREREWMSVMGEFAGGFGPDNDDVYAEFTEEHGFDHSMNAYFEKHNFGREDLSRMETLRSFDDGALDEYLEFQSSDGGGHDLLTVSDDLSISEMKNLIDLKTSLLKEIEAAKEELSALKASAKAVVAQVIESIRQFNFADSTIADKAAALAGMIAKGENVDTAKAEFQKLAKESIEQEYLKGGAPFADVSKLNPEWYSAYAEQAKEAGIVNGNPDGTLGAAAAVNNAAAVKMLANALEIEPQEGTVPATFSEYPEWAKQAVSGLVEAGFDVSMFDSDPTGKVTRAEFAEAAANLLPEELTSLESPVPFKDIGSLPADLQEKIESMAALGVVDADGTYDPEGELTKAALTKFLVLTQQAAVDALTTQDFVSSEAWSETFDQ